MRLKIFLLITSFCLVQVKSQCPTLPVRVLVKDILEIQKRMNGFAEAVTLRGAKCLWEIKTPQQTFQNCYASKKDAHEKAVETFISQTIDAGETLNKKLPWYYNQRVQNTKSHMTNLNKFLKDCQREFSEKINKNELTDINQFMKNCKAKIQAEFIKLYTELQGIQDTTNVDSQLKAVGACEKVLETQIKAVNHESKFIIQHIKECMNIL